MQVPDFTGRFCRSQIPSAEYKTHFAVLFADGYANRRSTPFDPDRNLIRKDVMHISVPSGGGISVVNLLDSKDTFTVGKPNRNGLCRSIPLDSPLPSLYNQSPCARVNWMEA